MRQRQPPEAPQRPKGKRVQVRQSLWQRILGVGRIEGYTGGDKPEFILEGMPGPNHLRDLIKTRGRAFEKPAL